MNRLLLHDVEVEGRRVDVLVEGSTVRAVGPDLDHAAFEVRVEGRGGALLPGLHDHHAHLLATAAAMRSVACGPADVGGAAELAAALTTAPGDGWVRGVGYHESVAGPLDRHLLDRLVPGRPVRIQHRSGALWMLNSKALTAVTAILDDSPDTERDPAGKPTGRLWRYDDRLRAALPEQPPDLAEVGRRLAGYGVTGVTDATPGLDPGAVDMLGRAVAAGELPHLTLLGAPDHGELGPGLTRGPRKLLLRDHDLPGYDELRDAVASAREAGRAVAVHCVTRESLLLTLAVLKDLGPAEGDRIEHAAVVPPEATPQLRGLGLRVITQPDFLRTRGDQYVEEVDPRDAEHLYPYASLIAAGVPTAASSDAPYSSLDPWTVIRSATTRSSVGGRTLSAAERVPARVALDGYLTDPATPGGMPRAITAGSPADLCLLHLPLQSALRELTAANVRGVVAGGVLRPGA